MKFLVLYAQMETKKLCCCLVASEVKLLSRVRLFATPWTVAYQAPLSMGFSRQECWSELPFPSPGDLPEPGIKPGSPALQADALPSEPPGKPCLVATLCTTLCEPMDCSPPDSLSMGFLRQEYWSGLPFPSPENLPDPGIKPTPPALAGGFFTTEPPEKLWGA